ncbi:ATP-binding protein [Spirillospora sp. CA-294931]|uniref:ATP-binding protein n=1 Tax=Spirillospora sp. CA-294931 TaxID=3240042 RepID=UPI003D930D23
MVMVSQPVASELDEHDLLIHEFEGRTELVPEIRALARTKLASRLSGWPDLVYDVTLALTELMSNAIRHSLSGSDSGHVRVAIRLLDGPAVRVEVSDDGSETTPLPNAAPEGATCGRGLHVVDALSESWGVRTGPRPVVWAVFTPGARA